MVCPTSQSKSFRLKGYGVVCSVADMEDGGCDGTEEIY
jgi:hypothetical protein